jgi:hypothetical protein
LRSQIRAAHSILYRNESAWTSIAPRAVPIAPVAGAVRPGPVPPSATNNSATTPGAEGDTLAMPVTGGQISRNGFLAGVTTKGEEQGSRRRLMLRRRRSAARWRWAVQSWLPMRGSVGIQQLRYETARLPFAIPSFAIVPGDAWTVGWRCLPLVFRMIGEIVRWGCEPVHSARAERSVRQVSRPELILVEPVALLPADLGIPPDHPLCEARQADSSRERLVSNLHPLSTAQHAGTRCARS